MSSKIELLHYSLRSTLPIHHFPQEVLNITTNVFFPLKLGNSSGLHAVYNIQYANTNVRMINEISVIYITGSSDVYDYVS